MQDCSLSWLDSVQFYQMFPNYMTDAWYTSSRRDMYRKDLNTKQERTSIHVKQYVSEWLLFNAKWVIYQLYHWRTSRIWWVHAKLDFYTSSSLIQKSTSRHVISLGHIILIPSQPVFALTQQRWVLTWEATYTNYIFFGLTRLELEPTTYDTQGGLPLYHRCGSNSKAKGQDLDNTKSCQDRK